MKTAMIFIGALLCFSFVHGQNENSKRVTALWVIISATDTIKTNHLFIEPEKIADLYLLSKAEASQSLGPISEDVVFYVTLKKDVRLLNLSELLAHYHLDVAYKNIPVYKDGEAIPDPGDILSTKTGFKNVTRTSTRIDLTTMTGLVKPTDIKTRH
jgi:hypothetical protein